MDNDRLSRNDNKPPIYRKGFKIGTIRTKLGYIWYCVVIKWL
jgi:hypothetical protein